MIQNPFVPEASKEVITEDSVVLLDVVLTLTSTSLIELVGLNTSKELLLCETIVASSEPKCCIVASKVHL